MTTFGATGPIFKRGQSAECVRAFLLMREAGLTEYRFDVALTDDAFDASVSSLQSMQMIAGMFDITLRPVMQVQFGWPRPENTHRTDNGRHQAGDAACLYAQGNRRAYEFASRFADIDVWELGNEINLLARDANGSPLYGRGQTIKGWSGYPIIREWAAVLRGMTDGLDQIGRERGTVLGKTLGTTTTNFGFLDYMKTVGVRFNRISYHIYDGEGVNPHRYWNGEDGLPPFDLFKKLDSYGVPVTINEVNAAEIYGEPYGAAVNEPKAMRSLAGTLKHLTDGTFKNLESVLFYSLVDEPHKPVPENRFGLFRANWTPKPVIQVVRDAVKGRAGA